MKLTATENSLIDLSNNTVYLLALTRSSLESRFDWRTAAAALSIAYGTHFKMSLSDVVELVYLSYQECLREPRFEMGCRSHRDSADVLLAPIKGFHRLDGPFGAISPKHQYSVEQFYNAIIAQMLGEMSVTRMDWCTPYLFQRWSLQPYYLKFVDDQRNGLTRGIPSHVIHEIGLIVSDSYVDQDKGDHLFAAKAWMSLQQCIALSSYCQQHNLYFYIYPDERGDQCMFERRFSVIAEHSNRSSCRVLQRYDVSFLPPNDNVAPLPSPNEIKSLGIAVNKTFPAPENEHCLLGALLTATPTQLYELNAFCLRNHYACAINQHKQSGTSFFNIRIEREKNRRTAAQESSTCSVA